MAIAFDATWDRRFTASPFRLRFELGGEEFDNCEEPVPRLMQALTRSRAVRDASFSEAQQLWAVVRSWGSEGFEALHRLGFRESPVAEWQVAQGMPDNSEEMMIWRAYDVTDNGAACDTLLWSGIVNEMPVKPKAPVDCYLADMERGILVHVYDDRGMDVTALAASALTTVRQRFESWISPCDRGRVEAVFEPKH